MRNTASPTVRIVSPGLKSATAKAGRLFYTDPMQSLAGLIWVITRFGVVFLAFDLFSRTAARIARRKDKKSGRLAG